MTERIIKLFDKRFLELFGTLDHFAYERMKNVLLVALNEKN